MINISDWKIKYYNKNIVFESDKEARECGWYDWYCDLKILAEKTQKLSEILSRINDNRLFSAKRAYFWFRSNRYIGLSEFDDIRISDLASNNLICVIQIDCSMNKCKYAVFGTRNNEKCIDCNRPLFETENDEELVSWLNK